MFRRWAHTQEGRLDHVAHRALDHQHGEVTSAIQHSQQDDLSAPDSEQHAILAHNELPAHLQTLCPQLGYDPASAILRVEAAHERIDQVEAEVEDSRFLRRWLGESHFRRGFVGRFT